MRFLDYQNCAIEAYTQNLQGKFYVNNYYVGAYRERVGRPSWSIEDELHYSKPKGESLKFELEYVDLPLNIICAAVDEDQTRAVVVDDFYGNLNINLKDGLKTLVGGMW